jgi:phage-related protein
LEFRVTFYRAANGETPLVTFLDDLRRRQPTLHRLVAAGLIKLRTSDYHGPPLTARVDARGIFELRVGSTDIARVFYFFRPGQEIVCTNGYVKKAQKLDTDELDRAKRYKTDWETRHHGSTD